MVNALCVFYCLILWIFSTAKIKVFCIFEARVDPLSNFGHQPVVAAYLKPFTSKSALFPLISVIFIFHWKVCERLVILIYGKIPE